MRTNPSNPLDIFLRAIFLSLLLAWCFLIAQPFFVVVIWSMIISVSLYPVFSYLVKLFRGRKSIALTIIGLAFMVIFLFPAIKSMRSILSHADQLNSFLDNPDSKIPPPTESVKEWPVVGDQLYVLWSEASSNLESFLENHREKVKGILAWFLATIGGVLKDVVLSIFALIVALLFLNYAQSAHVGINAFATRLLGNAGESYVATARDTIRSVVKGILLVAIIQTALSYIGLALMGIPGTSIITLLVLILAITQLPISIVLIPVAIYSFTMAGTTAAIIFSVYIILVGLSDNLLKPIFLGRGLKVPMIVILIGSIGGMLMHGIVGLFVGAVVLAIGYETYRLWLNQGEKVPNEA
jgi:predicted PurR-regulated permease PerM